MEGLEQDRRAVARRQRRTVVVTQRRGPMKFSTRPGRIVPLIAAVAGVCLLPSQFNAPVHAQSSTLPALPAATVDTTYNAPSTVTQVPSGANLQTAINNAALGTTL